MNGARVKERLPGSRPEDFVSVEEAEMLRKEGSSEVLKKEGAEL